MERFVMDERTGLKYELVGDYYLIAGEDEPEGRPIGIWGISANRGMGAAASPLSQGASPWAICQSADKWRIECLSCGY